MSRLKSNPNIDLSSLHLTGVSFEVFDDGSVSISSEKTGLFSTLSVKEKEWRKVIFGSFLDRNTLKIEAVGIIKPHKSILRTLLERKYRTPNRIIHINGKNIGVLEICRGAKSIFGTRSLPLHHALKKWETLYYDHTTKDVQIYYKGRLFAAATYHNGIYQFLILKDEFIPLCLGLALASIDSLDNEFI